jgi:uncharacterized membrane protein YphA (DoxX/SURF4 family)
VTTSTACAASARRCRKPRSGAGSCLQFIGAGLVLSGVRVDVGAWCLIVFTVLATAIFHRFWQRPDPVQKRVGRLFFMSNAAVVGGLLL